MGRGPNQMQKIRVVATNTPPVFGINIPADLAKKYEGVYFKILNFGDSIILESGTKHG